jgi:hypothetical protein
LTTVKVPVQDIDVVRRSRRPKFRKGNMLMKHSVALMAGLCLLAGPVFAAIDYINPEVETIVTRQQILDYTGAQAENPATGIGLRAVVINNAGNFVITDRGGAQGEARLLEINLSSGTPVFNTIATEGEMAEVLETSTGLDEFGVPLPTPRLNFIGLAHFYGNDTDYYYLGQFGQNPNNCTTCADEVIEVAVSSSGTAIRRVGSLDGINGLSYRNGYLYFPLIGAFSNQLDFDGIYRMNVEDGNFEEIVDIVDFDAVTGGLGGTQGSGMKIGEDGRIYFFSEEFRGGSDDLVVIDLNNEFELSILEPKESFDPNFPGIASIALDSNDTMFAFDQFPAVLPRRFIVREANGTLHYPNPQTIIDGLGLTNQNQQFFPNDSLVVGRSTPAEVSLYAVLADGASAVGNPRLIKITFTDPNIGTPVILGDINGDEVVNVADVTLFGNLLAAGTPPGAAAGDFNEDGVVDLADFNLLVSSIVD